MSLGRLLLILLFPVLLSSCAQGNKLFGGEDDPVVLLKEIRAHLHSALAYIQGGRSENPCNAGSPQVANCYYVMKITAPYDEKQQITASISEKVCVQNQGSGNRFENCDKFEERHSNHVFPVKDSPKLVVGFDYEFISQVTKPRTNELVCVVYNDQTEQPDATRCEPRTTPLKLYTQPGP